MIYVYVIGLIISVAAWMVIFVQSLRGKKYVGSNVERGRFYLDFPYRNK